MSPSNSYEMPKAIVAPSPRCLFNCENVGLAAFDAGPRYSFITTTGSASAQVMPGLTIYQSSFSSSFWSSELLLGLLVCGSLLLLLSCPTLKLIGAACPRPLQHLVGSLSVALHNARKSCKGLNLVVGHYVRVVMFSVSIEPRRDGSHFVSLSKIRFSQSLMRMSSQGAQPA